MTILLALGFYALGAISMALFTVLMMAWHDTRHNRAALRQHRRRYRDHPISESTDYDVGMEAAYPLDVHDGSEPD
jgi:heme exporter protein D